MDTPQYEQQQLFFTQEEVDSKINFALETAQVEATRSFNRHSNNLRNSALDWFKSEAKNGTMTREDATDIFNGLASALGWETVDSIQATYAVTVSVNGIEVGVFEGIEADDEDNACDLVIQEVEAEATFNLDYSGQTIENTVSAWDLEITAEAVEE